MFLTLPPPQRGGDRNTYKIVLLRHLRCSCQDLFPSLGSICFHGRNAKAPPPIVLLQVELAASAASKLGSRTVSAIDGWRNALKVTFIVQQPRSLPRCGRASDSSVEGELDFSGKPFPRRASAAGSRLCGFWPVLFMRVEQSENRSRKILDGEDRVFATTRKITPITHRTIRQFIPRYFTIYLNRRIRGSRTTASTRSLKPTQEPEPIPPARPQRAALRGLNTRWRLAMGMTWSPAMRAGLTCYRELLRYRSRDLSPPSGGYQCTEELMIAENSGET